MVCSFSLIEPMWLFKYITFGLNCMFILLLFRLIFVYVCLNTLFARIHLFVQVLVSWSNSAYVVLTWIHIVHLLGFLSFAIRYFECFSFSIQVVYWFSLSWLWLMMTTMMKRVTMNVDHDTMDDDGDADDERRPRHHGWWWRW